MKGFLSATTNCHILGTKLDDDFHTQEKKMDLYVELVDDLQIKTKEYLQPNPTVRAKMAAVKVILYKYLKYLSDY